MVRKILGSLVVLSLVIGGGAVLQAMGNESNKGKSQAKGTKVKMSKSEVREYEKMSQKEAEEWWKVKKEEIRKEFVKRYKAKGLSLKEVEEQVEVEMRLTEHYRKKRQPQLLSLIKSVRKSLRDNTLCPPDHEDMRVLDLGYAMDPRGIPVLIEVLKTCESAKARADAASALGMIGDKSAIPDLIEVLSTHKNVLTRAQVATAIGQIGDKSAIPALKEALEREKDIREKDRKVLRVSIARSLAYLGEREKAFPVLVEAKEFEVFVETQDKRAIPAMREALKDKDPYIRVKAAGGLIDLGEDESVVVSVLIDSLKYRDDPPGVYASYYLKKLLKKGNKDTIFALKEALKHENKNVKQGAEKILQTIEKDGNGR